jgi:hypothetical protein
MKETTQHYYLIVENPELVEIGQPIIDGDTIIGFISDVIFDGRAEVVLWETSEFEFLENMENISDSVENPLELFEIAMGKASERVKHNWKEMIKANER